MQASSLPDRRVMRVGLVLYGTLDTISGGYLYDRKLVEYLRSAGDSVEIVPVPWRNYARHLTDNLSNNLFQRLRAAHFDVLVQDELNHPSLFGQNRRLRGNVRYPILSIVHHLRCQEARPAWQNLFYRWIERAYLVSVDGFIFNSRTTRDAVVSVLGRNPFNSIVAYPAGNRFNPQVDALSISRRAKKSGPLQIVFVGNLIPRKGLHILLEALAQLPLQNWQLAVVGNPCIDANYAARIRHTIAELHLTSVKLVGAIRDEMLAGILASSHLLVVPSDYEGFGIVYLEAMSFGLPAIATTSGAASEIIADGENGFLVPPNDVALLANRIDVLCRDRVFLTQLSLAAHARFRAHPRWDESMARVRKHLIETSHAV